MRGTWNTTWVGEIPPLLFWQRDASHHRSQTICIYIQKRCSHVITAYTVHIVKNSPV